jgi:hypothetical protein
MRSFVKRIVVCDPPANSAFLYRLKTAAAIYRLSAPLAVSPPHRRG